MFISVHFQHLSRMWMYSGNVVSAYSGIVYCHMPPAFSLIPKHTIHLSGLIALFFSPFFCYKEGLDSPRTCKKRKAFLLGRHTRKRSELKGGRIKISSNVFLLIFHNLLFPSIFGVRICAGVNQERKVLATPPQPL